MDFLEVIIVLGMGLALSGCAGMLDGVSASSGQNVYFTPAITVHQRILFRVITLNPVMPPLTPIRGLCHALRL